MPTSDLDLEENTYLVKGTFLVEGVVELDPMSGRYVLRQAKEEIRKQTGEDSFDPQAALATLRGQEVRIVIVPLATVQMVVKALSDLDSQEGQ